MDDAFFQPLQGLAAASAHARPCPEFSDDEFVRLGVQRVLEMSPSGRGFLQEHGLRFTNTPGLANYFDSLHSERRGQVLRAVNLALLTTANATLHDRLAAIPELAVGHFYSLNLRTHTLRHLAVGHGLHEHDMSVLKRIKPKGLRQGVPKGKRVLLIYDKAGIDFDYWKRCRHECAVYFISRVKAGMVCDWIESVAWDEADARNHGVTEDRRVLTREGHAMRIVYYTDPQTGAPYEFLTNEPDLPAGVIAELYRRR